MSPLLRQKKNHTKLLNKQQKDFGSTIFNPKRSGFFLVSHGPLGIITLTAIGVAHTVLGQYHLPSY